MNDTGGSQHPLHSTPLALSDRVRYLLRNRTPSVQVTVVVRRAGRRALSWAALLATISLLPVLGAPEAHASTEIPVSQMFPAEVKATPLPGGASVQWTPVTAIGILDLSFGYTAPGVADEYQVLSSYDPATNSGYKSCRVKAPATSCTVTGLVDGVDYTFTVRTSARAVVLPSNFQGEFRQWSDFSPASSPVSPCCRVPSSVQSLQARSDGDAIEVSWQPPDDWGGAASLTYTVSSSPGGSVCTTVTTSCRMEGLAFGSPYTFDVSAANSTATGAPTRTGQTSLAVGPPGAPPSGTARYYGAAGAATVSWQAPARSGGLPVSGYVVTAKPGGKSCATSGRTSCKVSGLRPGLAYTFTVNARNAAGTSAASPPIVAGRLVVPASRPRNFNARPTTTSVSLSWERPQSAGGGRLLQYVVREGNVVACTGKALRCEVSGLSPGSRHTFSVYAVNTSGLGRAATAEVTLPVPVYTPPPPPVQPGPKPVEEPR